MRVIRLIFAIFALLGAAQVAQAAGSFVDLSRDSNKVSPDTTNLLATGEVKGAKLFGFVDSAGYGEVLVGRSFALGKYVTSTPYAGVEWLKDGRPKVRGMVITSAQFGSFGALSVIEFAGVTGNFHLEQIGYTVGQVTLSLVHHSGAGNGFRVDWQATQSFGINLRYLEQKTTFGANYTF